MKAREKEEARRLRVEGKSLNEIAIKVGVAKGSVSLWVRDIALTEEQKDALIKRNPVFRGTFKGAITNRENALRIREKYQLEGKRRCRIEPEDYRIVCALYWAEGDKSRGTVGITNTDSDMLVLFVQFLRRYFSCKDEDFMVRVMAHLNNGLTAEEIRDFWLKKLGLPLSCFRDFTLKTKYYSDVNKKTNKRVYGGCSVRVASTKIIQTVYGSIQELFGIDRPEWMS